MTGVSQELTNQVSEVVSEVCLQTMCGIINRRIKTAQLKNQLKNTEITETRAVYDKRENYLEKGEAYLEEGGNISGLCWRLPEWKHFSSFIFKVQNLIIEF